MIEILPVALLGFRRQKENTRKNDFWCFWIHFGKNEVFFKYLQLL